MRGVIGVINTFVFDFAEVFLLSWLARFRLGGRPAFGEVFFLSWHAGSRPGGRGTFLCFAKEKCPKERRPPLPVSRRVAPGNLRCSPNAGRPQTRLRLRHAAFFFRIRLCCSARAEGAFSGGVWQCEEKQGVFSAGVPGCWVYRAPSVCAEERSGGRTKGRACLSEASLRGPRPARAPQVARREAAGHRQQGSPFFAYFLWRSKESRAAAGPKPGQPRQQNRHFKNPQPQ